jgi:Holliday junction resolvasome RuvABC endonuclease subunit
MDNRYPDFSDSLVVVFDGAQSNAAAIEDFARTFISQNVQTVMLVSPSDRDIQMTQILTATGQQSWLINSD